MDRVAGPPAYAWDWFTRQRLLWREARTRLATGGHPSAARFRAVESRGDVVALLRAEYPRDEMVRDVVSRVVTEFAFLGRTDRPFDQLGVRNPPRGLRWWWTLVTGEQLEPPAVTQGRAAQPPGLGGTHEGPRQLTLDEVHEGLGG